MTGDADPDALDRWERVQAIFGEALDLEAHARRDFLGRRCGEDSDLRAEVESLLEASEESDAYFGDLADRAGITLSPEVERDADLSDEDRATDPLPGLIGRTVGHSASWNGWAAAGWRPSIWPSGAARDSCSESRVGRRDEGVELLRRVLEAQIANLGDPHPVVERTRSELLAAGEG
jgi:hypothetical protein